MQICSQNINLYKAALLFQELLVMPDAQSYHWPQKPPQLRRHRFMATEMAPNSPGSFSLWGGSYESWHNNWIKIWPTAKCMEVTGVFPVSRGPHFLSEWQGGSGVKEKGQRSVLHQPPALSLLFCPFLLNSLIQCVLISSSGPTSVTPFALLSPLCCWCSLFYFPPLGASLMLTCSLSPPRRTHKNRPDYISHSASQIKLPWTQLSNKK